MNANKIEKGDIVAVNFNCSQYTFLSFAKVLNVPCATGDSWIFEDLQAEGQDIAKIHYVSEGCTITLREKSYDSNTK